MNAADAGDIRRILWARALRTFGDGSVAIPLRQTLSQRA